MSELFNNNAASTMAEQNQISKELPLVSFEKVSLRYRKHASLFELFFNKDQDQDFWALKEISFSINEGETLGIIGRNGSGKSTLSRVCTKVYLPDRGKVDIKGKVQLLALGVGFKKELTGRENVYISGSLLGLKTSEIRERITEIEEFADIDNFFDEEVRTYSSGMRSRLAFAIATAIHPDILILDEVLTTGDSYFKIKAMERMKNLHSMAKCAIIVSHSPAQLKELCHRVLWLEKGRIIMQGGAEKVLNAYQKFCKNPVQWMEQHPEFSFNLDLDDLKQSGYFLYHAPRYKSLMKKILGYHTENSKILEIGRSRFSKMAYNFFGVDIDDMGPGKDRKALTGHHYQFDLNHTQDPVKWRKDLPKYDIILFAEVIEHLNTNPLLIMQFLKTLLTKEGVIILQMPNAGAFHKKIQRLTHINLFSLNSGNKSDPIHFKEYTASEISDYCSKAGFEIKEMSFDNYFDYRYIEHANGQLTKKSRYRLVNMIYSMLPKYLRPGIGFILKHKNI